MRYGRPKKKRIVRTSPASSQFSPRGKRGRPGYIELYLEEYEAIRLVDHRGLDQTDAAGSMGVSQQTFSRVIRNARKRLAEALVLGKIIKVAGGDARLEEML